MGHSYSQQGTFIQGGELFVSQGATWYTDGEFSLENGGSLVHSGEVLLTEDWTNNSGGSGVSSTSNGLVDLIGNTQTIKGSNPTRFYNLALSGGATMKTLAQDAEVRNRLDLADAELVLNANRIHVSNPDPSSLVWNSGFVSGDSIGGYILRSTDRTATYRFPVGNVNLVSSEYRGVDITPSTGDSSVFGVRLAATDASTDRTGTSFTGAAGPYSRSRKAGELFEINSEFYHHIGRFFGESSANVKLYFFDSDHLASDRKYTTLGQWNKAVPRFEDIVVDFFDNETNPANLGSPGNYVEWNTRNFNDDVFALSIIDENILFVPQIFSPNGDGLNDVLYARSNRIEEITFMVYNRWGEKVFESRDVDQGWDGRYRGQKSQSGVYVYYIKAQIKDFGEFEQKGNITLVR